MTHRFQSKIDAATVDLDIARDAYLAALAQMRQDEEAARRLGSVAAVRQVQASREEATRLYRHLGHQARIVTRWTHGTPIGQRTEEKHQPRFVAAIYEDVLGPDR